MKVHFPSLVENEILKEDGSIIKRFGLAWGDALPTNMIQIVSNATKGKAELPYMRMHGSGVGVSSVFLLACPLILTN